MKFSTRFAVGQAGSNNKEVKFLRKDKGWNQCDFVEYEAKKLFGKMWHSIRYKPEPFVVGTPCNIRNCPEDAVGRSLINFLGTVYTLDLCKTHKKEMHGMNTESFPELKGE